MRFVYRVEVEVEREQGKFESRESIGGQIAESIESANPDTLEGGNGGTYAVQSFDVTDISDEEVAAYRAKKAAARAARKRAR